MILSRVLESSCWNLWKKIILCPISLNLPLVCCQMIVKLHFFFQSCIWLHDLVIGEESVKELQRKRHSAAPDVSFKGRVRKVAKWNPESDDESDEENECEFLASICSITNLFLVLESFLVSSTGGLESLTWQGLSLMKIWKPFLFYSLPYVMIRNFLLQNDIKLQTYSSHRQPGHGTLNVLLFT